MEHNFVIGGGYDLYCTGCDKGYYAMAESERVAQCSDQNITLPSQNTQDANPSH